MACLVENASAPREDYYDTSVRLRTGLCVSCELGRSAQQMSILRPRIIKTASVLSYIYQPFCNGEQFLPGVPSLSFLQHSRPQGPLSDEASLHLNNFPRKRVSLSFFFLLQKYIHKQNFEYTEREIKERKKKPPVPLFYSGREQ